MQDHDTFMILSDAEIREMSAPAMRDFIQGIDDAVASAVAESGQLDLLTDAESAMYIKVYSELLLQIELFLASVVNISPDVFARASTELEQEKLKVEKLKAHVEKGRKGFAN